MSQKHLDETNLYRRSKGQQEIKYTKPGVAHGEACECAVLYTKLGLGTKARLHELADNIRYDRFMSKSDE